MTDRAQNGRREWALRSVLLARARAGLRTLLRVTDRGGWVAPGVLGCAYPRTERALASSGVRLLVNLHERPHHPAHLERHGLRQVHLPVKDFASPSPEQIERSVRAILDARTEGETVAVHCGGGLGRTGTILAIYLLASSEGLGADEAIWQVRALRPGSIETAAQLAAVRAWAERWTC